MSQQFKELSTIYNRTKDINGEEFVNKQPLFQTCSLLIYSKFTLISCFNVLPAYTESLFLII
jgi:hypothetical protein